MGSKVCIFSGTKINFSGTKTNFSATKIIFSGTKINFSRTKIILMPLKLQTFESNGTPYTKVSHPSL